MIFIRDKFSLANLTKHLLATLISFKSLIYIYREFQGKNRFSGKRFLKEISEKV